jgi:hypothetical protein
VNVNRNVELWDFQEGIASENKREYIQHWHKTIRLTERTAEVTMASAQHNQPPFFHCLRTIAPTSGFKYTFADIDRDSLEPFDNGTLDQDIPQSEMYPEGVPYMYRWASNGNDNISDIYYNNYNVQHDARKELTFGQIYAKKHLSKYLDITKFIQSDSVTESMNQLISPTFHQQHSFPITS